MPAHFIHDPDAHLDYSWDWSDWLEAGETIVTKTIMAGDDFTAGTPTETGGVVTVFLDATASCQVTCRITTSAGRADDRSIRLTVAER